MTFVTCLARLTEEGVIDRDRAKRFRDVYDEMEARFTKQYGSGPGEVLAGDAALRALDRDAQLSRRQAALQIQAQRQVLLDMARFDKGSGKDGAALVAMMARDPSARAPFASIEGRAEQLDFEAQAMIADFLEKHRRNLRGQVRHKADLDDVLRARHGDAVDNAEARAFSDAIGEVFEMQRQRFNLLGGDIGYDAKYGISHRWAAHRVRAVSYEVFRDIVRPELDLGRMRDPLTGEAFSEQGLDDALRAVYETIRTDGLNGLGSSDVGGSRKLANRRSDARFLQFKDGDAWLRVNEKFGASDPFTAIVSQISGMNRDLAMMERFGPNPDATVRWGIDQMKRRAAQSADPSPHALLKPQADEAAIQKVWSVVNGENSVPVLGGPFRTAVVKGLHGTRDVLVAAKLGKAVFAALGDMATVKVAKRFNGLPQTSRLLGMLRELNPLDAGDRQLSARLELGMRDATTTMMGLNRFLSQSHGPAFTKVLADGSMRVTGLNAFTEAGQHHFGKTFLGELAASRGQSFDALNPVFRGAMERYGIDGAMWDKMRSAPIEAFRGREFMSGALVRQVDAFAAERMMDMVLSETAHAVQMTTVRGRALTEIGRPGTFAGEAGRSLFQFKGFTASFMLTQGMRLNAMDTLGIGALYAARLAIGLTLFGAATLQLRQLSYGQDLRPMDGWEFWVDAMLQGGTIGIIGDVVGSFKREGALGLGGIVSGPMVGAAGDVGKMTVGNIWRAAHGDETRVARDGLNVLRKNTPGSNTWYAATAFNRMVIDQLGELADPSYASGYRRLERTAREQGTDYWWAPGQALPDRAPELTNVAGE